VKSKTTGCSGNHGRVSFPRSLTVQCGAMTVIWVSALPLKEVDAYGAKL